MAVGLRLRSHNLPVTTDRCKLLPRFKSPRDGVPLAIVNLLIRPTDSNPTYKLTFVIKTCRSD
jgi:hypothetical protein